MIFVDTGALIARYVQRDQYHDEAVQLWRILQNDARLCFTSNFVLDETITLLARRSTHQFAAERGRNFYASKSWSILRPDAADDLAALELLQKYADQGVSFTDCVSWVLMRKQGIKTAFSFDRHFAIAGFDVEP